MAGRAGERTSRISGELGQNLADDIPTHASQPRVHAGIEVSQPGVIKTHQVEDSRMQIVHMHSVFDCRKSKFVGRTVGDSTLNVCAC